jgi:hypothetical protein
MIAATVRVFIALLSLAVATAELTLPRCDGKQGSAELSANVDAHFGRYRRVILTGAG